MAHYRDMLRAKRVGLLACAVVMILIMLLVLYLGDMPMDKK